MRDQAQQLHVSVSSGVADGSAPCNREQPLRFSSLPTESKLTPDVDTGNKGANGKETRGRFDEGNITAKVSLHLPLASERSINWPVGECRVPWALWLQ